MVLPVSSRVGFKTGLCAALLALAPLACEAQTSPAAPAASASSTCPGKNGGILLSPGFCATIFADNIGQPFGTWCLVRTACCTSTRGAAATSTMTRRRPVDFEVALQDTKGTGRADVIRRFGDGVPQGSKPAAPGLRSTRTQFMPK